MKPPVVTTRGRRGPDTSGVEREWRNLIAKAIRIRLEHLKAPKRQEDLKTLYDELERAYAKCRTTDLCKMIRAEMEYVGDLILLNGDD